VQQRYHRRRRRAAAEGPVGGRPEVEGFLNMFMLMGLHTAPGNIPRSIKYSVEWVSVSFAICARTA